MAKRTPYYRLGASLAASLAVMYFLAYSQIDAAAHFQWSLSILWISLSMVSAMGLVMLGAMHAMLPDRKANLVLAATFAAILALALTGSRLELLVGDDAFLRSMIPHHSRAIHMCQEAVIQDPDIATLCDGIIETQREEIAEMERIMARRG